MRILSSLIIFVSCVALNAATITIHRARDNALYLTMCGPELICDVGPINGFSIGLTGIGDGNDHSVTYNSGYWDFGWDAANPNDTFSGKWSYTNICAGSYVTDYTTVGWHEALTFDSNQRRVVCSISGPYPNYSGGSGDGFTEIVMPFTGTEYWIDFSPDGSARVSTTQPGDFGKWAWDGSVNPNYVEPLAPAKKAHGKGHNLTSK